MRTRGYPLLIATVLILSGLVIGLRGTNPQVTSYQVGGLQAASSIQGIGLGPVLWSDAFNDAAWHLSSNMTQAYFSLNHALNLNVSFTSQSIPQAVIVSRPLNLSLDRVPVVVAQIEVSQGVHYGIRFSGATPAGASFEAWSEGSPLQHRSGLGSMENISINLQVETYLANGQAPIAGSTITRLSLYVEATAGTSGTFAMNVASIQAFALNLTAPSSLALVGNFQGVVIHLNLPSVSESLFQAYVDFNIHGSPTLRYTPFLMGGTVVLAQGFTYVQNGITSFESAVLVPSLVSSFPRFLPDENSSSIIISANAGLINQFKLANLSFRYTSTPSQSAGFVDPTTAQFMLAYYFLFLFITPVVAVILVTRVFKTED